MGGGPEQSQQGRRGHWPEREQCRQGAKGIRGRRALCAASAPAHLNSRRFPICTHYAQLFTFPWHFTVYQVLYKQHLISPSQKPCTLARELTLTHLTSRNGGMEGKVCTMTCMWLVGGRTTIRKMASLNPSPPPLKARPHKEHWPSELLAPTPCHILS